LHILRPTHQEAREIQAASVGIVRVKVKGLVHIGYLPVVGLSLDEELEGQGSLA
jgi:hypothetical protein